MKKLYLIPLIIVSLTGCSNPLLKIVEKPLSFNQVDICEQDKLPIRDEKNLIVQEGKENFLVNTKISPIYFNEHFVFQCAGEQTNRTGYEYSSPPNWVIYKFSVGDYATLVSIYVHFDRITNVKEVTSNFIGLKEIENTLPEKEALEKFSSCLDGNPTNLKLELTKDGLFMTGQTDKLSGSLNLETGECVSSSLFKRD